MLRWFLFVVIVNGLVGCASLKPIEITVLPKAVEETSGMVIIDSSIWTINDSQHSPKLFRLSQNGLVDSVFAYTALNEDWEDLSGDSLFIYVADIGNNLQLRHGFLIYSISRYDKAMGDPVIGSQQISFARLPDQPTVFPKVGNRNFDLESLFVKNGYAYLISKNIKTCGKSYGKLYRVPTSLGSSNVQLIDSFRFNEPITGAAYDDVANRLVVTGYLSCFVFDNFNENNFNSSAPRRYRYNRLRQYEGLTFSSDRQKIFLSNEKGFGKKSQLFEIPINYLESDFGRHAGIGFAWRRLKLSTILWVYNIGLKRTAERQDLHKSKKLEP